MTKYLVSYTETNFYSIEVEADTQEEAHAKVQAEIDENDVQSLRHIDQEALIQVEGEIHEG